MSDTLLNGLRVVDMTEALAGPYCSMMLGDLGADVIKVERPGNGDQSRKWGPPFIGSESAYFLSVNRNKRSIELNIKDDDDNAVLMQLIDRADILLMNIPRLASMQRAGIDPDTLLARNPRLIIGAISGYGHTGPKAGRPGYDLIAQGESGTMAMTGASDGGPARFPTPIADITAGLYTLIGIQSALYERDRPNGTGKGQFVDVALVDAQTTWLANFGGTYFATEKPLKKMGNQHPSITPYQPLKAKDKMLIVAVGTERLWSKFSDVLGITDSLAAEARFMTNPDRNDNRDALIPLLEDILKTKNADDWVEALVAAGVPAGPINYPRDSLNDPHFISRDMVVELEHPTAGRIKSIGCPIKMSASGPTYRRYPPRLGEHNQEIRAELAKLG